MSFTKEDSNALFRILERIGELSGQMSGVSSHVIDLAKSLSELKIQVDLHSKEYQKELFSLHEKVAVQNTTIESISHVMNSIPNLEQQVKILEHEQTKRSQIQNWITMAVVTTLITAISAAGFWVHEVSVLLLPDPPTKREGSR